MLLLSVGAGALAFVVVSVGVLLWSIRQMRVASLGAAAQTIELRKSLRAADTILRAEPQVLLYWDEGGTARLMVDNLAASRDCRAMPTGTCVSVPGSIRSRRAI